MRFSILVPAYKVNYLKKCIDSVLAQSYEDWELIVVNDASPYDIDSVLSEYDDIRIKYKKNKENYGLLHLVDNWNHCLEYATGDYVMCIGDDDELLPNCLTDYASLICKFPDKNVYHTRLMIINEASEIIGLQEDRPEIESAYSMIWHFMKGGRTQRIGDWLFNTAQLVKMGGFVNFPCAWGSDDLTAFSMAMETGVANLHIPGFLYRNHSQSISNNAKVGFDKMEAWLQIESWYNHFFLRTPTNELDQLYLKLIKQKFQGWLYVKKLYDLCENIAIRKRNTLIWWKRKDYYRVSKKMILTSLVLAIKKSYF